MIAHRLLVPALTLLAAGCTGSTYNQGKIPDPEDTADPDTSGGGTETGGEETGGEETGGETGDTEEEVEEACVNWWHPIHVSGWSKSFTATYEGATGTATEQGMDPIVMDDGTTLYQFRDAIFNSAGEGYDSTQTVGCDYEGGEGMFLLSWKASYTYLLFEFLPITDNLEAQLSSPRRYLSPEWAVNAEGEWEYSYTLSIKQIPAKGAPQTITQQVSGTYQDAGMHEITLFDGTTVQAYKLTNNFLIVSQDSFGGTTKQDGYIEQYWVKGLGMVKETFEDQTEGTILLSKELTSYSGLEIRE